MGSSDNQINKPQRGRPKRADLPDVNINRPTKYCIVRELLYEFPQIANIEPKLTTYSHKTSEQLRNDLCIYNKL